MTEAATSTTTVGLIVVIEKERFHWKLTWDKNTNLVTLTVYYEIEADLEPTQTSEVDLFSTIVNSFQSLTIFTKYSILDVLNMLLMVLREMY